MPTTFFHSPCSYSGPVVCNVVTAQPDAYIYMLPSPDGRHIFVSDQSIAPDLFVVLVVGVD